MPKSTASAATSIDATQRQLIVGIVIATLMTLAIVIADLASGGRPDPPTLRAAATLLDGAWRFHTGDDPSWANANTDDSGWETIDMTAVPGSHDGDVGLPDYVVGWMAHGHPGYHGYAWYRRAVTVPAGRASWDILGPTLVEDGYELYWNGQLLGGSGRLGPSPARCRHAAAAVRPSRRCGGHSLACSPSGRTSFPVGAVRTAAACTAHPYSLRGPSAMRSTACSGSEP